jgi:hypothetical protein
VGLLRFLRDCIALQSVRKSKQRGECQMTPDTIPISPAIRAILIELSAQTGQPASELLATAVEALRQALTAKAPVSSIPGVNLADVWEADAQADAGQLTPHADVFAKLRARP